jgi:hypothetical protein
LNRPATCPPGFVPKHRPEREADFLQPLSRGSQCLELLNQFLIYFGIRIKENHGWETGSFCVPTQFEDSGMSPFCISMRTIFLWNIVTQWTEVRNPGGRFAIFFYTITTFWVILGPFQCLSTRIKSTGAWCWPLITKKTIYLSSFHGTS